MLPTLCFAAFLLLAYVLSTRLPGGARSSGPTVFLDEEGVRHELKGGKRETVRWDELVRVEILTTSDGPYAEDVFWLLFGKDGTGCAVPGAEAGPLLERVQRLEGADNMQVIAAMGSTSEARFLIWEGEPGGALPAASAPTERTN